MAPGSHHILHLLLFCQIGEEFFLLLLGQADGAAPEFLLQLLPSGGDVLLPLLLLEPGPDLVAGLAGLDHLEPVTVRALGIAGDDLDDHAGFHHCVDGHDASIHLGAHHAVAHRRVNGIGKVDDGGAGRQADNIALGGEYKHFLRGNTVLMVARCHSTSSLLLLGFHS